MGMEFGWWDKDDDGVKWQISARFHGGTVVFSRKHGHHTSWEDFAPTDRTMGPPAQRGRAPPPPPPDEPEAVRAAPGPAAAVNKRDKV
jgi:hypothetical protein